MRVKRLLSALLAAALLAGMLTVAPASAASGGFTDITDPTTAGAAEMLRLLGVVDGTGGSTFNPNGTLTRAQFCKMTVEIMGRGDEEPAQRGRTIFTDVGSTHWARGYVNLASSITIGASSDGSGGTRLIMGVGDGTFQPDRPITYGEAVTILMRVLGYGNSDVASGAAWYSGYVALAYSSGLADGLSLSGDSNVTRGQAAQLFYNLLFTKSKGSDEVYLTTLGGKLEDEVIILSTDATADDGTTGSVLTTSGTYKTDRTTFSSQLNGTRGQLVLDKDKKLLAILPEEENTFRSVTVLGSPEANAIPILGGEELSVTLSTKVYNSDSATPTTYEAIWTSLRTGTPLVLCYNGSGKLDYIYRPSTNAATEDGNVMVAKNKPNGTTNPFASLASGAGSTPALYKNGMPAQPSDIRQYDVATYDKGSNSIFVSDLKLCGLYENVYPNTAAPSTITMMGATLKVLPCAAADLSSFKVGQKVTLLLTTTGEVAGAVSPSVASSNAIGVAELSGSSATIKLLDGILTLTGQTSYSGDAAAKLNGSLVTVSSSKAGYLSLSRVTGGGATASLDLDTGRLGSKTLAPGARFYEQVGNGALVEIERKDITLTTIPAGKITYVGYDWAGRASQLVLNDVTGDRYTYGRITYQPLSYDDSGNASLGQISVENGSQSVTCAINYVEGVRNGVMGGIAASLDKNIQGTQNLLAGFMPLNSLEGVRRAQFDVDNMLLTTNSMVIPVSKQVQCYNKTTQTWFSGGENSSSEDALRLALAYSDNITVYYDRSPEEGGKVRILVVE